MEMSARSIALTHYTLTHSFLLIKIASEVSDRQTDTHCKYIYQNIKYIPSDTYTHMNCLFLITKHLVQVSISCSLTMFTHNQSINHITSIYYYGLLRSSVVT